MVDEDRVQQLIESFTGVIVEDNEEGDSTSLAEVVSALFTVLDRVLGGVREMKPSVEKTNNVALINKTLMDLIITSGKPH